ncbi:unnamed protein product, partial [Mesorhabditis belari]|uniref:Uncharacterized protein n=1 Tax=Mesorhabditis belari TaxID=2138241 RepID=A0AAF3J354_9BILA
MARMAPPHTIQHVNSDNNLLRPDSPYNAAHRLRGNEGRAGSVGDCSRMALFRASPKSQFRRRSTRRRLSNAQRLADLEDFINKRWVD